MLQIPNELLAVMLAEAFAIIALIWKMDRRMAVMETELRYIRHDLGLLDSSRAGL